MFRTAVETMKLFLLGVSLGLLVAPRSGWETRRMLRDRGSHWLRTTLGNGKHEEEIRSIILGHEEETRRPIRG